MSRRQPTAEELAAAHRAEIRPLFESAVSELRAAQKQLKALMDRGSYTIGELQEIRRGILGVVRNNIDPVAFGHMPDKRHY